MIPFKPTIAGKINHPFIKIFLIPVSFIFLVQCNVIWTSPKMYNPPPVTMGTDIMSLDEYTSGGLIATHERPYIYTIEKQNGQGAVLVFGTEHTNQPENEQFPVMEEQWRKFKPSVAMVEGRLGFLFSWFQNPVEKLGEGGFIANLARSEGVTLYSWEPGRDAEVEFLMTKYPAPQVASFFCLRPYLNKYSNRSTDKQNKIMENFISERTKHPKIAGSITSLNQLDSLWNILCPSEVNWRIYNHPQNGWPAGLLSQMGSEANLLRDIHMCNSIIDLVNRGERVFITMGSSHAPRIEQTLKKMIK